jgi:hypothetical protein
LYVAESSFRLNDDAATLTSGPELNLREQVEQLLPGWERWYPSLFDAAKDLGLIKARVCAPSSLLLSNRHSHIQARAEQAHREMWGGTFSDDDPAPPRRKAKRRRTSS